MHHSLYITLLNWSSPVSWLLLLALVGLLLVQLWLIRSNQSLPANRKALRLGLNLLLWGILVAYVVQPHWPVEHPATHVLLVGNDVPAAVARRVKDSLHLKDSFTARNLKNQYDSVTLLGQQFPPEVLTRLSQSALRHIPYNQPDHLQQIHWKGMVRQGEMQRVVGQLTASEAQPLRLRFGNKTLDSLMLQPGPNRFTMQFPAFARGQSEVELVLGQDAPLDTLPFYTRPTTPLTVQFLLNSPDFESKTLAGWLGKQGHTVDVSASLSKNISSSLRFNKSDKASGQTPPDLVITEPANAGNPIIRKAVADGKAVLFINLTEPEQDSRTINQAVGSRWQAQKISNEPAITVGNGLTALPYRFADQLNQFSVGGFPVFVQQTAGRIGVSLLSETYPLSLSGDTLTYNRLWTAVLARLSRPEKNTVQAEAPLYQGLEQTIYVNNPTTALRSIRVGTDTVQLSYSPLNERSAEGTSLFGQRGWQTVQDSLALYVSGPDGLRDRQLVEQFVRAHTHFQSLGKSSEEKPTTQIPDWLWLTLLIACFTALWLEPKLL